jgi:hypothetical protein
MQLDKLHKERHLPAGIQEIVGNGELREVKGKLEIIFIRRQGCRFIYHLHGENPKTYQIQKGS